MEERVFGDEYCNGVYHGRFGGDENKYRLEKFEDNWYMADGTGSHDAVLLIDKNTPLFITDFYPDAPMTVHLYVIENLRQGAKEHEIEHADEIENLHDQLDGNDTTMAAMNASYDTLMQNFKDEEEANINLDKINMGLIARCRELEEEDKKQSRLILEEASDYQKEIGDLENRLGIVNSYNADLATKLTKARLKYNELYAKANELEERLSDATGHLEHISRENAGIQYWGMSARQVMLQYAHKEYEKIQDYVLANALHMGHEDEESHADIIIKEHAALIINLKTAQNLNARRTQILKDAGML